MTEYRRAFISGGTYFFTVNLADRRQTLLVDRIDALRSAFRYGRERHPFALDAVVVLPDHLHAIWTLPEGDTDFPLRWRLIKAVLTCLAQPRNNIKKPRGSRRTRNMATPLLGTRDPRRGGLEPPRRLHPFQSRQTRLCVRAKGLAVLFFPARGATRPISRRLGRRCGGHANRFRRTRNP